MSSCYARLALITRLVLAGVFVRAAIPKIADPMAFEDAINGFRVIEGAAVSWIAIGLPWFELIVGIGLLIPKIRRISGVAISVLLLSFVILHASAWQRGIDMSCGCFGAETEPNSHFGLLILRNLILLALCLWLLYRDFYLKSGGSYIAKQTMPTTDN